MENLNYYYTSLFDDSKRKERIRFYSQLLFLLTLVISSFLEGKWLLIIVSFGFLLQILAFILKQSQDALNNKGNELQTIAMLNTAFEKMGHGFEISQIKGTVNEWVHKRVNKKEQKGLREEAAIYLFKYKDPGLPKLASMIQENAYFNHHLYQRSSNNRIWYLSAYVGMVILIVLFSVIFTPKDYTFFIPRLGLIFLSFFLLYEEIEKILKWRMASKKMLSIDNQLEKKTEFEEDLLHDVFTNYCITKSNCSSIPDDIYQRGKDILNKGWFSRIMKDYILVLNTIAVSFEDIDEPWAIIGSFNLAVRGVALVPNDIDIITTSNGALLIGEKFPNEKILKKFRFEEHDTIRSTYGVLNINQVKVDIFGDIENKMENGKWEAHIDWTKSIQKVRIGQRLIPVLTLEYERSIYKKLGKDEIVKQIDQVINSVLMKTLFNKASQLSNQVNNGSDEKSGSE